MADPIISPVLGQLNNLPGFPVSNKFALGTYLNQLAAGQNLEYFGDGSDGNVVVSSGIVLARDMYYNNLTLIAGANINTLGFRIFVKGILDITAAPASAIVRSNGAANGSLGAFNGLGGSGGSGGLGTTASAGESGVTGGAGGTVNGTNGTTVSNTQCICGTGGASGKGGNGSSTGVPTIGRPLNLLTFTPVPRYLSNSPSIIPQTGTQKAITAGQAGSSGSGGGGDGGSGAGGGGSGAGQGGIFIFANTVKRGSNTAASCIKAPGGNGGNGGTTVTGSKGGGGGGGGGSGGWIYLVAGSIIGSIAVNALDVSGGNGGNGGNGTGTGTGGDGGQGGGGGLIHIFNLSIPSLSISVGNVAGGTVGTAAVATTGGFGGPGETFRTNL